jgi:pimeloyl-ACP methyl ester carboxylesterase
MKKLFVSITILLLILVYVLFLRKNHIHTTEEARQVALQPSSQFITWKGNDIHYTDEGNGPIILMIHGFAGSFYNFQALSEKLKDKYRIIRVDLPGMGLSDFSQSGNGLDYYREYKDFFTKFIDSLQLDSFYVMGNSLGGSMASLVALSFPDKVKGLVLLNSAGYEMHKVIKKGAGPLRWRWFKPVLERGLPFYVVKFGLMYPFADRSKFDKSELPIDYALVNREGVLTALNNLASSRQELDTSAFKRIKAPTLIIWGKEDVIIPVAHAEKFHRDIPNSIVKIYSPCGHMPMMEIPDSVVVDFEKFVADIN